MRRRIKRNWCQHPTTVFGTFNCSRSNYILYADIGPHYIPAVKGLLWTNFWDNAVSWFGANKIWNVAIVHAYRVTDLGLVLGIGIGPGLWIGQGLILIGSLCLVPGVNMFKICWDCAIAGLALWMFYWFFKGNQEWNVDHLILWGLYTAYGIPRVQARSANR